MNNDMENTQCDHQCSSNCRRNGCNCDCGEWHMLEEERLKVEAEDRAWNAFEVARDEGKI